MDKHTIENWQRVKEALESADKTDSYFYVRACAIVRGEKDPMIPPKVEEDHSK